MSDKKDKAGLLLKSIIETLKTDKEIWEPLAKAAERYSATLKVMQSSSLQFIDALNKVAETSANANGGVNDIGVGIHQIADVLKKIESKRADSMKALNEEFVAPLGASYKGYEKFALKFEKEYAKDHKKALSELKDAEKDSAKAAKKGSDALQQAITNVNNKVKAIQELTKTRLREAIVEQRKRYCFVVMHLAPVLKADIEMFDWGGNELKNNLTGWMQLAVSPDTLPPAVEELVEIQQRTFVAVQSDENYSDYYGDSGYNTIGRSTSFSSSYSGHQQQQEMPTSSPPPPPVDMTIRAGDNCKGLYDYQGDGDKLSFGAGDVISVMEADGSGWCLGELRGAIGWFPSNYVEKVSPPPPMMMAPKTPMPPPMAPAAPMAPKAPMAPSFGGGAPPPPAPSFGGGAPPPPAPSFGGGGPPPPPAPSFGGPPPPPAAPSFSPPPSGGGRGALLSSIQKGTGLKKVQTNDRSAPKF